LIAVANTKITELTQLTNPVSTDVLPIVDVGADVTRKISIADLLKNAAVGTAAAPGIAFDGDSNTGIYSPGSDQVSVATGGTERFRIDGTGQIEAVSLGTAAAPAYSWTGDPNTGIYSPGADQVAISTNGTGRLFVTSDGTIKTSSHISLAGASAGGARYLALLDETSSYTGSYVLQAGGGSAGFGGAITMYGHSHASYPGSIYLGTSSGSGGSLIFGTNNALDPVIEKMRLDSSGRLGLGTSSPGATLDVSGNDNLVRFGDGTNTFDVRFKGPNNWDVQLDTSADKFNIRRNSSSFVTVDGAGRLGIGTTSPITALHVDGTGNQYLRVSSSTYSNFVQTFAGDGSTGVEYKSVFRFVDTDNGERARIDSSGRLLVGTSSARSNVYYTTVATTPAVQFESVANSYSNGLSLINYSASGYSPVLTLGLSASNTQGANTALSADFEMGAIQFAANDGSNFRTGASIVATNDQASSWAVGDCPTRLVFSTTADGASSPTERMRIKSAGGSAHFATQSGAGSAVLEINASSGAGTTDYLLWATHSATTVFTGTVALRAYTNGNVQNINNSYGAISDVKFKENIVNAGSQWSDIKSLQVRKYNFKEETGQQTHTQIGLIAQEVELVSPGLVNESPDRDEDGNDLGTVTKSVNYSVLYMKAVKALQEAMERIETLEAKVAALESQ
jgi:hypothetical protein